MTVQKAAVLVAWVLLGACLFLDHDSWWVTGGRFGFWAMLVAHIGEFFAMRSVFEKAGGSTAHHFVQTLLYGLFHWSPLREAQEAEATAGGHDG